MPKRIDHDQRYEEIGRVAAIAVSECGHEKLTFVEIARRAGCSVGGINHYAKTKDEILLLASKFVTGDLRRRLLAAREKYSGMAALRTALYEFLPCNSAHSRGEGNLIFSLWSKTNDNPKIREVLSANVKWCHNYFAALIAEAQQHKQLATQLDSEDIAQQTLSHIDALTLNIRLTGKRPPATEQVRYVDEWINYLINLSTASDFTLRK